MKKDKKVKVVIVDDELHAIMRVHEMLLNDKRYEVVGSSIDPEEAVEMIAEKNPDLIFLDIQMPVMNGFEMLKALKNSSVLPYVIFITSYDHFAVQAIKHAAFDYLLKPIDKVEFINSLDRFYALFQAKHKTESYTRLLEGMSQDRMVRFDNHNGQVEMLFKDILYIQADFNYARVYRSEDDYEALTMNLVAIEKLLPATQFIRINRSVIVNFYYLLEVNRKDRKCVLEKDGVAYTFSIPVVRIRQLEKVL